MLPENLRGTIEESLRRQQLNGFLTAHNELRYIADLWANLLNVATCYSVGRVFFKRDIITYLLVLFSLRQITSSLFTETCLKLGRIGGGETRLKSFVVISYMEIVTRRYMNLFVITNVSSRRLICSSLQKIHSMVHFRAYVMTYLHIDLNGYIIAIFGFAEAIHKQHCSSY